MIVTVTKIEENKPTAGKRTVYLSNGVVFVTDMPKTAVAGSSSTSGGVLTGILAAIPGILSALFPNGANGGGNSPIVYTDPTTGNTNVNMGGQNNSLLLFVVLGMAAYILFTGQKPIKGKR